MSTRRIKNTGNNIKLVSARDNHAESLVAHWGAVEVDLPDEPAVSPGVPVSILDMWAAPVSQGAKQIYFHYRDGRPAQPVPVGSNVTAITRDNVTLANDTIAPVLPPAKGRYEWRDSETVSGTWLDTVDGNFTLKVTHEEIGTERSVLRFTVTEPHMDDHLSVDLDRDVVMRIAGELLEWLQDTAESS